MAKPSGCSLSVARLYSILLNKHKNLKKKINLKIVKSWIFFDWGNKKKILQYLAPNTSLLHTIRVSTQGFFCRGDGPRAASGILAGQQSDEQTSSVGGRGIEGSELEVLPRRTSRPERTTPITARRRKGKEQRQQPQRGTSRGKEGRTQRGTVSHGT